MVVMVRMVRVVGMPTRWTRDPEFTLKRSSRSHDKHIASL